MSWPAGDGLGCVVEVRRAESLESCAAQLGDCPVSARQGRLVAGATHSFPAYGIFHLATFHPIPAIERCKP
jgi:hypothetical protein